MFRSREGLEPPTLRFEGFAAEIPPTSVDVLCRAWTTGYESGEIPLMYVEVRGFRVMDDVLLLKLPPGA